MDDVTLEKRLSEDYSRIGGRLQISESGQKHLAQLIVNPKHTKVQTRILLTQVATILFLIIMIPATAYAAVKVSDALMEKVEDAGLSNEQIDKINQELLEGGFSEEDIKNFLPLHRNENGQTYGIDALGADLIAVTSSEGLFGYVYREELYPEQDFKTPEEAIAWQKSHTEDIILPVYKSDGLTAIGTFIIER